MESVFYIIAKVVSIGLSVLSVVMFLRVILQFFGCFCDKNQCVAVSSEVECDAQSMVAIEALSGRVLYEKNGFSKSLRKRFTFLIRG